MKETSAKQMTLFVTVISRKYENRLFKPIETDSTLYSYFGK